MKRADIPGTLNVLIALATMSTALFLLWLASHGSTGQMLAAALLFSLVNSTIFSLLHEAVHGIFHPSRLVNEGFGIVLAAFFPTALTPQRGFHLAHHRFNRTDHEFFDGYNHGDKLWLKKLQWYGIISGEYWSHNPVACILWLFFPESLRTSILRNVDHPGVKQQGAAHMLQALEDMPIWRSKLDVLFSIVVHTAIILILDLSLIGWFVCYAAFAVNWGGLQYVTHAFSKRSVRNGAWNLRVGRLVSAIYLNYQYHLCHHQNPSTPWIDLPSLQRGERKAFWPQYLKMWKGPVFSTEPAPSEDSLLTEDIKKAWKARF